MKKKLSKQEHFVKSLSFQGKGREQSITKTDFVMGGTNLTWGIYDDFLSGIDSLVLPTTYGHF